ncbi:coiled-coil domain-containing protein [Spirosoma rhododendri]|uniref:Chromosome segregation protein SMC n=1 Tax=Spirosoma rhododendri TaxID=2728024 RepID=A0A7L5DQJ4_9BACT|nr:hypothetical protein [Spirosoma rhododendri]QJD79862.1 hypothetical protein HH216_16640 [Spirosoma rhododendri]
MTDYSATTSANTSSRNKGIRPVAVGVLVGVASLLVYLFVGAQNETRDLQEAVTTQVEQLARTQTQLDSLSTVLDTRIADVRRLGGSVGKLEKVKASLEADKKRLTYDMRFSARTYDRRIHQYESFLASRDADIRLIRDEKNVLADRARVLEEEREQVLSENAGLRYDRDELSRTVATYSAQNDDLQRKVTLASAMKALNVEVRSLTETGRERQGGTYRASRTDRLKILFTLAANPLATKNTKDIYLRVLDPTGSVLSDDRVGGTLTYDGLAVGYSMRQAVPFENNDQRVELLYHRDSPYRPGSYTVELYAEGFRIGQGEFILK